jgi:hypothetical protein
MRVRSRHPALTADRARAFLKGLPDADGYEIIVRPLRYRTRPHLAAYTEFDAKTITIQVPEPFLPFGEIVQYGAKRIAGKGMRFVWLSEGLTFRTQREVVRFLYCHEWYHWYLKEVLGQKSAAETACDRFALHNYRRREVTLDDAQSRHRGHSSAGEVLPARRRGTLHRPRSGRRRAGGVGDGVICARRRDVRSRVRLRFSAPPAGHADRARRPARRPWPGCPAGL